MEDALEILKATAEENRLRLLLLLEQSPKCLGDLSEALDLAPSTVSKHLSILVHAGLVESWPQGRWRYFAPARDAARPAADQLRKWVKRYAGGA
jgi:DNA-binding transcriptional ArsR family regulator